MGLMALGSTLVVHRHKVPASKFFMIVPYELPLLKPHLVNKYIAIRFNEICFTNWHCSWLR